MGFLDKFENGVERAVNNVFAKTFRGDLKPVEMASRLRREVDEKAAVVGRDRTVVPNEFTIELATADYDQVESGAPRRWPTSSPRTSRTTPRASATRSSGR